MSLFTLCDLCRGGQSGPVNGLNLSQGEALSQAHPYQANVQRSYTGGSIYLALGWLTVSQCIVSLRCAGVGF